MPQDIPPPEPVLTRIRNATGSLSEIRSWPLAHGHARFAVRGKLDRPTAEALEALFDGAIRSGARFLLLEAAEVSDVSTAGIAACVVTLARLEPLDGRLALVRPAPAVQRALEVLGFGELFDEPIAPDAGSAELDRGLAAADPGA